MILILTWFQEQFLETLVLHESMFYKIKFYKLITVNIRKHPKNKYILIIFSILDSNIVKWCIIIKNAC